MLAGIFKNIYFNIYDYFKKILNSMYIFIKNVNNINVKSNILNLPHLRDLYLFRDLFLYKIWHKKTYKNDIPVGIFILFDSF